MFISIYTMADRVSYRNLLVHAFEYYQAETLNQLVTLNPKTHYDSVTNQMKTKTKNYGDIRLSNIRKYLDKFPGYVRSEMQKKFHESFLQVIISFIIFFFLPLFIDTNPFLFYNRQWLSTYTRTTPRQVLNCTNVL